MPDAPIAGPQLEAATRTSPRQKECLRLVYHRRTSKEIAGELELAVGTIDTYISEAVAAIGARNRRHAAEILHAAEGGAPPRNVEYRGARTGPSLSIQRRRERHGRLATAAPDQDQGSRHQ